MTETPNHLEQILALVPSVPSPRHDDLEKVEDPAQNILALYDEWYDLRGKRIELNDAKQKKDSVYAPVIEKTKQKLIDIVNKQNESSCMLTPMDSDQALAAFDQRTMENHNKIDARVEKIKKQIELSLHSYIHSEMFHVNLNVRLDRKGEKSDIFFGDLSEMNMAGLYYLFNNQAPVVFYHGSSNKGIANCIREKFPRINEYCNEERGNELFPEEKYVDFFQSNLSIPLGEMPDGKWLNTIVARGSFPLNLVSYAKCLGDGRIFLVKVYDYSWQDGGPQHDAKFGYCDKIITSSFNSEQTTDAISHIMATFIAKGLRDNISLKDAK